MNIIAALPDADKNSKSPKRRPPERAYHKALETYHRLKHGVTQGGVAIVGVVK